MREASDSGRVVPLNSMKPLKPPQLPWQLRQETFCFGNISPNTEVEAARIEAACSEMAAKIPKVMISVETRRLISVQSHGLLLHWRFCWRVWRRLIQVQSHGLLLHWRFYWRGLSGIQDRPGACCSRCFLLFAFPNIDWVSDSHIHQRVPRGCVWCAHSQTFCSPPPVCICQGQTASTGDLYSGCHGNQKTSPQSSGWKLKSPPPS